MWEPVSNPFATGSSKFQKPKANGASGRNGQFVKSKGHHFNISKSRRQLGKSNFFERRRNKKTVHISKSVKIKSTPQEAC